MLRILNISALVSVVVAMLITFCGCTSVPKRPMIAQRSSATFESSKEKVWPLLVGEVGLKYPIQAIEKDSGLITTQFVQMPVGYGNLGMDRYVFSPDFFLATWAGLRMNLRIIVTEMEPGTTSVRIAAHYEAYEDNVSNSWIVARSNGSVENQILTSIEWKLDDYEF